MKTTDETTSYAQMGIAALLPGMQHMLTLMEAQLDEMRRQLVGLQAPQKKQSRPPNAGSIERSHAGRAGWPTDPEERKVEMARRMAARKSKKQSAAKKAMWAAMSPAKRKARLLAMEAGKKKKLNGKKHETKLAVAS